MQAKITLDLNNAAFADFNVNGEVSAILKELSERVLFARRLEVGFSYPIKDYNGNSIGRFEVTD